MPTMDEAETQPLAAKIGLEHVNFLLFGGLCVLKVLEFFSTNMHFSTFLRGVGIPWFHA